MGNSKRPTNTDLSKDIKEVKGMVGAIATKVSTLWDERLERIGADRYAADHPNKALNINQDLIKAVLIALGIISTLVTFYLTARPK